METSTDPPTENSADEQSRRDNSRPVALVTGGTGGLGGAICRRLCDAGYQVTATGASPGELEEFDSGDREISLALLDVTSDSTVTTLLQRFRRLDALVNCAGMIGRDGREFLVEGFRQTLEVNLTGTMRTCTAARPLLAEASGAIVNLASMLSFFGSGHVPAYSSSKGGVVQLTRSLAIAWASQGIRVNAVAPGWIETPLTAPLTADSLRSDEILSRTPQGRWGQPADVAGAVNFLCSAEAAFITGVVLPVDGGYSIA